MGEHQTGMTEVFSSIPTGGNLLIFLFFAMYAFNTNIANFV